MNRDDDQARQHLHVLRRAEQGLVLDGVVDLTGMATLLRLRRQFLPDTPAVDLEATNATLVKH